MTAAPSADLAALKDMSPAVREAAVTDYLVRARDQLTLAVNLSGPEAVAALKAQIGTAAEATKQLGLSKEIQTDAQEMVRRAEYALGKAIRAGQDRGEIRKQGETVSKFDRWSGQLHETESSTKAAATDYATQNELSGAEGNGIYALVDGVTATEFDAALSDAKAEGNVSRANVVRKLKGVKQEGLTAAERLTRIRKLAPTGASSHQIAREIGVTPEYVRDRARHNGIEIVADKVVGRVKRIDSNRIVQETVSALEGLTTGIRLVDFDDLDPDQAENWATSLTDSIRALNRLTKQIKEMTQ